MTENIEENYFYELDAEKTEEKTTHDIKILE
jgi:hypothetical protein